MSDDLEQPTDDDREGPQPHAIDLAALDPGERAMVLDEMGAMQAPAPTPTNGRQVSEAIGTPRGKTAAEILESDEPEVTYLPFLGHDGFIVEGWSHLMASAPRVGKTELLSHAVIPWLRLGKEVLWLSEESEGLWKDRLTELRSIFGKRVPWHRMRVQQTMGAVPRELLALAESARQGIVIGDTLRHVAGMSDENDAAEVRRAVGPWLRAMRQTETTFIALAHHRKGPSTEGGEGIAGSHAIVGLFDVILELSRSKDRARQNQRQLTGRSRRREVPSVVTERDDEGRMVVLGDGRAVRRQETERRCQAVLDAAGEALTTRQVHQALGHGAPSIDTVLRALGRLALAQAIRRTPDISESKERGTPRWTAVDLLSGSTE